MKIRDWPVSLCTIEQIAEFAVDSVENIQKFVREDRIPYIVVSDGILIPLGGFQTCMPNLYDLAGDLKAIQDAFGWNDKGEKNV